MDYISSKAQYVTSVISLEISEQLVRKVYESFLLKKHWVQTKGGCEKSVIGYIYCKGVCGAFYLNDVDGVQTF